jgi:hypothetical protein
LYSPTESPSISLNAIIIHGLFLPGFIHILM